MKRFVKGNEGVVTYQDITIQYIPHHNPDLVFYDSQDKEITSPEAYKRRDLSHYTYPGLHELFKELGLQPKSSVTEPAVAAATIVTQSTNVMEFKSLHAEAQRLHDALKQAKSRYQQLLIANQHILNSMLHYQQ